MSRVISFVPPSRPSAAEGMVARDQLAYAEAALVAAPVPNSHAVQFYENDEFLIASVTRFLSAGIEAGERLIVVASAEHNTAFLERLRALGLDAALASGQLMMLDARATLASFMVDGSPDPERFRQRVAQVVAQARAGTGEERKRIRAYGEMVDLLWQDGNADAALRLEQLWNEEIARHALTLLCAYAMGRFFREGDHERFLHVCGAHSHVFPTESFLQLDPEARLKEVGVLQQRAQLLAAEIQQRESVETKLRAALAEEERAQAELRVALARAQLAREQAEASCHFEEMLLEVLGHELRNPLNTIMMTGRLLQLQSVPGISPKHLDRLMAGGLRMKRVIEQMLDVTRARLGAGVDVSRADPRDLVALARKIIAELRARKPAARIALHAPAMCVAQVDGERFEQVLGNLLANALKYGDAARDTTLTIDPRDDEVRVRVHNFGAPIDPALLPLVFDPFKRARVQGARREGLGIGLYVCERIVSAHGGTLHVTSGAETGTCFHACFPRTHH